MSDGKFIFAGRDWMVQDLADTIGKLEAKLNWTEALLEYQIRRSLELLKENLRLKNVQQNNNENRTA